MPDLWDKCREFTQAEELRQIGIYPYFRPIESEQDTEVYIDGKKYLMFGSNSYLGLTNDPRVKEAAIKAIEKYGTGNAGSRFLNGTLDIHEKLEQRLAEFTHQEDALLFSTGFQSNLGAIAPVIGPKDYILIDALDHASIIDATRLAFGKTWRFKHNDMTDLEMKLKNAPEEAGKLIVVDGVFSMEGDIAKLPEIVALAKKFNNTYVYVDDAHSLGVLGKNGRGTANHFGLDTEVSLIMGTFSKSFASLGGFVAGSKNIIEYLKHRSRALIFSASMPPASVAAVDAALDIMLKEPERIERLWEITHRMLNEFKMLGYETGTAETPIIPLVIGPLEKTFELSKALSEAGVFINPVVPPGVPEGRCLIRTSYMANHTDEQLDYLLDTFKTFGKKLGII